MRPVRSLLPLALAALPALAADPGPADLAVLRAAVAGEVSGLQEALRQGGSPDARTARGESALWLAASSHRVEAVRALLDAGARGLDEPHGGRRERLLAAAAWAADAPLVRLLLERGADPGGLGAGQVDALAGAVASGSVEVATLLLDARADPNRRLPDGLTAVARAAIHGRPEVLTLLLDRKGDPERRDHEGNTALMLAAGMGREEVVRLLLARKVRLHPLNARQRAALGEARAIRDPAVRDRVVALLEAAGAMVGDPIRPVDARLLAAADRGDLPGVKAALARGADPEARGVPVRGTWIRDALTGAVDHPAVFRYLLERGSDPRAVDAGGVTLLHAAARDGAPEVVELLLARGLDPDARSRHGLTPLHQAMSGARSRPAVVALLLAGGADPRGVAGEDQAPLARARARRQAAVVRLLEAALQARAAAVSARADPALMGCWRTQAQRQVFADGTSRVSNTGCALEYQPLALRVACPGQPRRAHDLEVLRPGRYAARPVAGPGKPPGPAREADYQVEAEWLSLSEELPPTPEGRPPGPIRLESVLVRAPPPAGGACLPLDTSAVRAGASPPSAVALSPLPGWASVLKDKGELPRVRDAVKGSFLIGVYVPEGQLAAANEDLSRASAFLVASDDPRGGAEPLRPAAFPGVKAALRKELARMEVSCETERAICFDLPSSAAAGEERPRLSAGFVNVKGRLVVLHASAVGAGHEAPRRLLTQAIERLLADNP